LKTIKQHNDEVRNKLKEKEESLFKTGVECPDCKSELTYSDSSMMLSYPAQRAVHCNSCSFKTNIFTM